MSNKVKFGLSNVYVAKLIETENGVITYGVPFAMSGAVSLSLDPSGEKVEFYADNIKYYRGTTNNGYDGDLELSIAPEDFLTAILGQEKDSNGALIENADDITARFALMGQIDGDVRNRKFLYYDCTAERPKNSAKTAESSKEPQTDTISINVAPRSSDKVVKAVIELSDTNEAIYNAFFDNVYEKNTEISG